MASCDDTKGQEADDQDHLSASTNESGAHRLSERADQIEEQNEGRQETSARGRKKNWHVWDVYLALSNLTKRVFGSDSAANWIVALCTVVIAVSTVYNGHLVEDQLDVMKG